MPRKSARLAASGLQLSTDTGFLSAKAAESEMRPAVALLLLLASQPAASPPAIHRAPLQSDAFGRWAHAHGREYATAAEQEQRRAAFEANGDWPSARAPSAAFDSWWADFLRGCARSQRN